MKQWLTSGAGLVLLAVGLTGLPVKADDNEAEEACHQAVKAATEYLANTDASINSENTTKSEKQDVQDKAPTPALRFACRFNERPANFWQCVENRVKDGQSFTYAQSRCQTQGLEGQK